MEGQEETEAAGKVKERRGGGGRTELGRKGKGEGGEGR